MAAGEAAGGSAEQPSTRVHVSRRDCVRVNATDQPPELLSSGAYIAVPAVAETGKNVPAQPTAHDSAVRSRPETGRNLRGRQRSGDTRGATTTCGDERAAVAKDPLADARVEAAAAAGADGHASDTADSVTESDSGCGGSGLASDKEPNDVKNDDEMAGGGGGSCVAASIL